MKKILFDLVKYPEYGGISSVTDLIIPELVNNYDISVVSHRDSNKMHTNENITVFYCPNTNNLTAEENYQYYDNLIRNKSFDIIIYQDSYAPIQKMVCESAKKYNIKLISFEHNSPTYKVLSKDLKPLLSFKGFLRRILNPIFIFTEKKRKEYIYHQSYRYVLLCDQYINDFVEYTGLNKDKLRAINNPTKSIDNLNLELKNNNILFVGRLNPEKRVINLIKIWNKYDLDGTFYIVGDGPDKIQCLNLIMGSNSKNIIMEGFKDPIPYYTISKVFWMDSKFEGWPMTVIEAMSYGCVPIVMNTFSAVHDIIDNGINGFIIDNENQHEFAIVTKRLLNDEKFYMQIALASIAKAKKFDINIIKQQWLNLLKE